MIKGIKTIEVFDSNYYTVGEAFELTAIDSGKTINAILFNCEPDKLTFVMVGRENGSNKPIIDQICLKIHDLKTTRITRLIPEIETYFGKMVIIKTKEELIDEGFEIREDGVYRGSKQYLTKPDLQYLGWEMKIEYKDAIYYEDEKYKGFSLSTALGSEIDMYNVEPCMFKYLTKGGE